MTETTALYCYAHPTRETSLRCKRCENPICTSCAVRIPTGYICKDCSRAHKKAFDTAEWYDYLIGFAVTSIFSLIASGLIAFIGSFIGFFMFFIAAAIGGAVGRWISDLTLRAVGKRRSKALFMTLAAGVVLGALPVLLTLFFTGFIYGGIGVVIYLVIATPMVYSRTSGIQL
ncbi:MAG: hypothetical protein Q8L87_05965 [Anaerolineales bacterium]|jgi:hypothetical protein|nr:hypothetical protein [Anaerolineales bacterium]